MSLSDLKKAVSLRSICEEKLTPEIVVDTYRRACSSRVSWPPEAILANTLPGSDEHKFRAQITPDDVLVRYEAKIASVVERDSFEAPFPPEAHKIISHIKDDPRLNISPEYIHSRFIEAREAGRLREALFFFQSTELSRVHRGAFTQQEIGELFQLCLDDAITDTADSLVEIYKTTRDTPEFRSAITPQMAKAGFRFCVHHANHTNPQRGNPDFYAYQAILMLHHTIADDTLRSPQGISDRKIGSLVRHFRSVIQRAQTEIPSETSSIHSNPRITIDLALDNLEHIKICTLPAHDSDFRAWLTSLFENRVKNYRKFSCGTTRQAHLYLDALARYPSAKPV